MKRKNDKKRICKNNECNKLFPIKVHNQKFCSPECNKLYSFNKYHNARKGIIKNSKNSFCNFLRLRFEVFKRDNFICKYCGRNVKDKIKLVVDHIIPKSKGGKDILDNLITSCEDCNLGKGDVLLSRRLVENEKKNVKIKAVKCFKCNKNEGIYLFENKLICSDCLDKTF